jgi:serine/threonine-protein kinase
MSSERTSRSSETSEEARAFLQARLALFWKYLFVFMLVGTALALVGAFKNIGPDLVIDVVLAAEAGVLWWLCQRGQRSIRFLRRVEPVGLMVYFAVASLLGRYVLDGFVRERGVVTAEGALLADAYLSILGLIGAALWVVVRAAMIPSSPRRTILYTAIVGVPMIVTPSLLVPTGGSGLAIRGLDSGAYPWLPAQLIMMWGFVIIASAVTSRVIYGLRAQVREARRLGQYVLEEKIGEGGMGEVYRARHGMMRRPSALKLLRPGAARASLVVRFEREVQLTSRLTHRCCFHDSQREGMGAEVLPGVSMIDRPSSVHTATGVQWP